MKFLKSALRSFLTTPELISVSCKKNVLPKPPVPELKPTLERYLEYASVVAVGKNQSLIQTHEAASKFIREAEPLQKQLQQIARESHNWVTKYWLPEMYLKIRVPIPVNSNPGYIFPRAELRNNEDLFRYTSLLTRGMLDFKNKIDNNQIPKEVSTGSKKESLCMEQYDRIMNCYRRPELDEDVQVRKPKTHMGNEHVLVMCRNQAFVMHTRINGKMLSFADLEFQLAKIEQISRVKEVNSTKIGACGVGERNDAANFWREMLTVDQNAKSFDWAQSALFVVCLDMEDENMHFPDREKDFIHRGKQMLTGNGSSKFGLNRWYDATLQLVVSSTGINGLCIEHSTAEGIVLINMAEFAMRYAQKFFRSKLPIEQDARRVQPKMLSWVVSEEAKKLLSKQIASFDSLANDLELEVLVFNEFGKDAIKEWRASPDGFIQLAIQLAHYKTHGYLVSTYESASIRRFGGGRVDNIRANTHEALAWVTAMEGSASQGKKIELFREAIAKQAKVTAENITGYGIDNHLCALYVLARERKASTGQEVPDLFKDPLWSELMRFPLSTSQVTTATDITDSYLCYGAVVPDGYGCSYGIHPNRIVFSPSAFKSNRRTNLIQFKQNLYNSMIDMQKLLS